MPARPAAGRRPSGVPTWPPARAETRLAMNCSGKHAGMLLACLHNGWPVSGYLAPSHPLQQLLAATVADLTGEPIAATAVDGCGAPLFAPA